MKSIFNEFNNLQKGDLVYSPIIDNLKFDHTYIGSNNEKLIYCSTVLNDNKLHIYMFSFDEFGRYILTSKQTNTGERLLFLNTDDYISYINNKLIKFNECILNDKFYE